MSRLVNVRDILSALAILVAAIAAAWLVRYVLVALGRKAAKKTVTGVGGLLFRALGMPLFIGTILAGVYFGLVCLPWNVAVELWLQKGFYVALAAVGVYAALSVANTLLRWYGQEIAVTTKTTLDDKLLTVLRVGVPIVGGLLGVLLLLRIVGVQHPALNAWLGEHGVRIAIIVVLSLLAFFATSRGLPRVIKSMVRGGMVGQPEEEVAKRSDTLAGVLVATGQVVIIAVAILMLMSELDIQIAPILAGVGVAGIAIGFGAQSLVKDVITGLFIVMEGQYRVGDVVRIADISGLVEGINLRRTVLRDLDGIVHFVPNGEIRVASNFTKEYSRVNLNVSVAYGTNLDHAITVVNRVGLELANDPEWKPFILKPPQVLRVDNLAESGIDIKILGDTKPIKQWDIMGQLRKRIKEAFDAEGIEIPYPHTKVYFGGSPSGISTTTAHGKGRQVGCNGSVEDRGSTERAG
ncbi:MAG: mechanosensitive ion channel family protein [Chloroflexota bacterium]